MRQPYKLLKTNDQLSLEIFPAKSYCTYTIFTENMKFILNLFPLVIMYFFVFGVTIYGSVMRIASLLFPESIIFDSSPNAVASLYGQIFICMLISIPSILFMKSIYSSESLCIDTKRTILKRSIFGKVYSTLQFPTQNIHKVNIETLDEVSSLANREQGVWRTVCALYNEQEKAFASFGYWLSLHDQGILTVEIKNYLNTLRSHGN